MENTKTASGHTMTCSGYLYANIKFGKKVTEEKLVVFDDIKEIYLSKNCLKKLGIVIINTDPKSTYVNHIGMEADQSTEIRPEESREEIPADKKTEVNEKSENENQDKKSKSNNRNRVAQRQKKANIKKGFIQIKGEWKKLADVTREDLLDEFADVFAARKEPMDGEEFVILLEDDAVPSKIYEARTVPFALLDKLKDKLDQLESGDVIEKVTHPTRWTAPIVITPKKGSQKIRVAIDYRNLNEFVIREQFYSPPVIDVVQQIDPEEAVYFSKADAHESWFQLLLALQSRDLTTFLTPHGRYRFKRAPMGVSSVPDHYNRRMTEELKELKNLARVVDDTCIYGRNEEEHALNVIAFLQRCRERNIRLNEDKFEFKKTEIEFAGMKLSKDGFTIHDNIVKAVKEFPLPETITDMRSFHGLANQLAPFDEKVAEKLAPLRHLLKSRATFEMTDDEVQAFKETRDLLASPQTLAYYTPGQPVQVFTDAACTKGYGFVVKQLQKDGNWKPIMLGSRSLTDAETRYAAIEAEINAMTWALRKARKFLIGAPKFKIYTDHKPLVNLANKKRLNEVPNTRLVRNLLKVQDFNCEVVYIKGVDNVAADSLSRHPTSEPDEEDVDESEAVAYHVRAIQAAVTTDDQYTAQEETVKNAADQEPEYQLLKRVIVEGFPEHKHELDPCISEYWNVRENLTISDDGFILNGTRLLIPKALRHKTLEDLHSSHKGIDLTKARARLTVYWPQIDNQVEQHCRNCTQCQYDRPSQPAEPQIHYPPPERCFEYMSMDFGELQGKKYLITSCWKSGWFNAHLMSARADAKAVISKLRTEFMNTCVPTILFSDTGPPFNSEELKDFCRRWGIKTENSSAYYPQSNSYGENGVKQAKALLRKCMTNGKLDEEKWAKGLLSARNTPHKGTNLSPAMIVYGHQVKELVPVHKSALAKSWHEELRKYDHKIAQERQKADHYKRGTPLPPLSVGDPVLIQNKRSRRWDRYGVIQERNLRIRKYTIRLPSGLITIRNRRDLRYRFTPNDVPRAGTSKWMPFVPKPKPQNETESDDFDDDDDWPYQQTKPTSVSITPNTPSDTTPKSPPRSPPQTPMRSPPQSPMRSPPGSPPESPMRSPPRSPHQSPPRSPESPPRSPPPPVLSPAVSPPKSILKQPEHSKRQIKFPHNKYKDFNVSFRFPDMDKH